MRLRLLRTINVIIAVVVLLISAAVYWYAVRPLPQTSGTMHAPIHGAAVIRRDARSVPHIEASSWQDAIFLQGYASAQDRLWQMDGIRRFAGGELAEVFGSPMLASDETARRMRMRAMATAYAARLTPAVREVFIEYARGVNFYIDTHRGDYPLEFSLPGHAYDPRPWTVVDSLLVGLAMYRDLTDNSAFEISKGELMENGDRTKVMTLFPLRAGTYVSPGSNAWAISGAHSVDGSPLLANDTHLHYAIPGTWHLAHLKAPGFDVSGTALAGLPGIITGHNRNIAWGVTNLGADVMDLYAERMDTRNGRYIYKGQTEQAQVDRQFIGVRGSKTYQLDVWVTRHGPIIRHLNGKNFAMRWTAQDGFGFPFLQLARAQNWQQFRSALRDFWGPGQNFVYADRFGNIGYQAAGRLPIRPNFDGDVPVDGASGQFEWNGFIPFESMPSFYNPPGGIIATANQNPFPPDFDPHTSGLYADSYRVEQIRARLQAKSKLSVDDMLAIQKDVYSAYDFFLSKQVLAAFQHSRTSRDFEREVASILTSWNGQMDKDQAAPLITQLLHTQLAAALVRSAIKLPAKQPDILPRPQVIERLLRSRPANWVPKDDWDAWLVDNLHSALDQGRTRFGSPISKWRWGSALQWKFSHPVGSQLPIADRFFDIGPVPMSGSGSTVKQTTATHGPSERMVVDFADLEKSVLNLPAGESGSVASAHYKDQWPAYYVGKSFPMEFDRVDAKETLRVLPQ